MQINVKRLFLFNIVQRVGTYSAMEAAGEYTTEILRVEPFSFPPFLVSEIENTISVVDGVKDIGKDKR
jgi:hypothetical protein